MDVERKRLERMLRGTIPLFPLARLLGMRFLALGTGRAELDLPVDARLNNPGGAVHGGAIFTLLDSCMGFAATTTLAGSERALMVDASVTFLRPPGEGRLRGTGTVVRRGRQIIHVEAEARNESKELVARALGTVVVVASPKGSARPAPAGKPRAIAPSGGSARGSRRVRGR